MPELPEVETIRRQLRDVLPFTIESVHYSRVSSSILRPDNRGLNPVGSTIRDIKRHGKMLDFRLSEGGHIISRLGMSGGWRIGSKKITQKHTHIQFCGRDQEGEKQYLAYVDPRRFGSMLYLDMDKFKDYVKRLGVDIAHKKFTADYIYSVLRRYPKRHLKVLLLEQQHFAGIGNYIACEICARAGIIPTRRAGRVTRAECAKIVSATQSVLSGQLAGGGLTFQGGYSDAFGDKGQGISHLVVFHQEVCGLCNVTPVKKIVLGGRGTYYCPRCQR